MFARIRRIKSARDTRSCSHTVVLFVLKLLHPGPVLALELSGHFPQAGRQTPRPSSYSPSSGFSAPRRACVCSLPQLMSLWQPLPHDPHLGLCCRKFQGRGQAARMSENHPTSKADCSGRLSRGLATAWRTGCPPPSGRQWCASAPGPARQRWVSTLPTPTTSAPTAPQQRPVATVAEEAFPGDCRSLGPSPGAAPTRWSWGYQRSHS